MAVTGGKTNSPFIGINKFHVAKLLTDTETGATYDDVVSIPWLRSVQIEPENASETLYADNHGVAVANAVSKFTLTIEMAALPLEYKALLLGHTVSADGIMTVNADDAAPYFAVMFEITKQNGKKRFVKFLKVQFSEPSENPQTKEESITFNTPTIEATAIYRDYDQIVLRQADEEAEGYDATVGAGWYTSVDAA